MNKKVLQLNIEGELCPYPLIVALKKYKEVKEELDSGNKSLEIIVDHPSALENIPFEFRKKNFDVSVEQTGRAKWKITISKALDR